MAERRDGQRFPLRLRVDWGAADRPDASLQPGETFDISATGLYVQSDTSAPAAGSPVELNVRLPLLDPHCPVDLRGLGRVVRIDQLDGERVGVAVSFDRIELKADDWESLT